MLNRCAFIGNLGADPEIRTFQSGDKVVNMRLAVTERWKDKSGEKKEHTEWIPVAVFGPLASVCEKYLHKGSKVYIEGQLRTRKWQDQSGNDRYTTEIVMQGPAAKLEMLDGAPRSGEQGHSTNSPKPDDLDDDIPF